MTLGGPRAEEVRLTLLSEAESTGPPAKAPVRSER